MSDTTWPPRLETERLILRRPTLDDAEAMFAAYCSDPEVTRYLTWPTHRDLDDTHEYLEGVAPAWASGEQAGWVLTSRDDGALLGGIGLRTLSSHALETGYLLARSHWRQGLMSEALSRIVELAFAEPSTQRLQATCHVDNVGSRRLLETLGFEHEGTLRRHQVLPNISDDPQDMDLLARIR
ncbi:MAG: GNAT family N-acetyltransferase [Acidobacteriota bacterium]